MTELESLIDQLITAALEKGAEGSWNLEPGEGNVEGTRAALLAYIAAHWLEEIEE